MDKKTLQLMKNTALDILDQQEREMFGVATTCTSGESKSLSANTLIETVQEFENLRLVIYYELSDFVLPEIKGQECKALYFSFGNDDVLILRADQLEEIKAMFPACRFVEYSQVRHEEAARVDFERMLRKEPLRKSMLLMSGQ